MNALSNEHLVFEPNLLGGILVFAGQGEGWRLPNTTFPLHCNLNNGLHALPTVGQGSPSGFHSGIQNL